MDYQVFFEAPVGFKPSVEVAGCYCEYEDKLLFLRRHPRASHGNTWGIPAGKFEKGEDARSAAIREAKEETDLDITGEDLTYVGKLYMSEPPVNYVFHIFRKRFSQMPQVRLNLNENHEARWATCEEAFKLPLIIGGREALQFYMRFLHGKK